MGRARGRLALAVALGVACATPPLASAAPHGVTVRSRTFRTSDGVTLHFLEAGRGRPLVFVPGWTMPAKIFRPQLRAFAATRRVIVLDPRWHGDSAKPDGPASLERMADDIADLAGVLKLQGMALAGWSLGADEVLAYVRRHGSSRLGSLVLIDEAMSGHAAAPPGTTSSFLDQFSRDRAKFTAAFVRSMYNHEHPAAYYREITAQAMRVPAPIAAGLLDPTRAAPAQYELLRTVGRPVLYLAVAERADEADLVRQRVPFARVEVFPTAGHAVFADEPGKFNAVLADFLKASR